MNKRRKKKTVDVPGFDLMLVLFNMICFCPVYDQSSDQIPVEKELKSAMLCYALSIFSFTFWFPFMKMSFHENVFQGSNSPALANCYLFKISSIIMGTEQKNEN